MKFVINMLKICLFNSIIIYDKFNNTDVAVLIAIVKIYLDLWYDYDRTVNISKSNYLQIFLKKNWMLKVIKLLK